MDDVDVELLVDCRGDAQTWEPVTRLNEDVPEKVTKCLRTKQDSPTLTELMETLKEKKIVPVTGRDVDVGVVVDVVVGGVVDVDAVEGTDVDVSAVKDKV